MSNQSTVTIRSEAGGNQFANTSVNLPAHLALKVMIYALQLKDHENDRIEAQGRITDESQFAKEIEEITKHPDLKNMRDVPLENKPPAVMPKNGNGRYVKLPGKKK